VKQDLRTASPGASRGNTHIWYLGRISHIDALDARAIWSRGCGDVEWGRRRDPVGVVVGLENITCHAVNVLALHAQ